MPPARDRPRSRATGGVDETFAVGRSRVPEARAMSYLPGPFRILSQQDGRQSGEGLMEPEWNDVDRWLRKNWFWIAAVIAIFFGYTVGKDRALRDRLDARPSAEASIAP